MNLNEEEAWSCFESIKRTEKTMINQGRNISRGNLNRGSRVSEENCERACVWLLEMNTNQLQSWWKKLYFYNGSSQKKGGKKELEAARLWSRERNRANEEKRNRENRCACRKKYFQSFIESSYFLRNCGAGIEKQGEKLWTACVWISL